MPTLVLPRLHLAQQRIVDEAGRYNVCALGRRTGKTVLGEDRVITTALTGAPCGWLSPSYKLLSDAWRSLELKLKPVIADISQQEKRLAIRGGGTVECWSLDSPDAARGRAFKLVVIDEAALVVDLQRAWEQSLRATLSDHQGSAWFLSTPRGIGNYFHTLYQRGQSLLHPGWRSWKLPTASNPYISPEEIEAAREDMTEASWAQEYEAAFLDTEGAVFRRIQEAVLPGPVALRSAVIGVDWAGTSGRGDYTAFTALDHVGQVTAIDRFRGQDYAVQRGRLVAFWDRVGRPVIVAERNSLGDPLCQQLIADGLPLYPFETTVVSKRAVIEHLALSLERGFVKIPRDQALIAELQAFSSTPLPGGGVRYSAPSGAHDDMVVSLALAVYGLGLRRQQRAEQRAAAAAELEWELSRVRISPY
ncbi:MAG: terminase large subunit domain-containing protein [Bryobacteraceae bacterium]